jgi:hypothetical protein
MDSRDHDPSLMVVFLIIKFPAREKSQKIKNISSK